MLDEPIVRRIVIDGIDLPVADVSVPVVEDPARCERPSGDAGRGEICDPSFHMCAPGGDEGKLRCQVGIAGVRRCFGAGIGGPAGDGGTPVCIADGQACLFADECCGKKCLLGTDGMRRCSSTSVPDGMPCSAHSDCASGNCNAIKMVCEAPVVACKPLGATCAADTECCNKTCLNLRCAALIP